MIMDATRHSSHFTGIYVLGPHSPRGWLDEALAQSHHCSYDITETPALSVALDMLREQPFDVVLLDADANDRSLPEVIKTVRGQTHEFQPVLILADGDDRREAGACLEAGAKAFISIKSATNRELAWHVETAAINGHDQRELVRLRSIQQRHAEQQQSELIRLLDEQISIFTTAANLRRHQDDNGSEAEARLPLLIDQCRELLKAYVVMGRGHLADEIHRFANELYDHKIGIAMLLQGFSSAIQELIHDRGTRSARHVYDRGNLLLLDLLLQRADANAYRDNHESVNHHSDLQ